MFYLCLQYTQSVKCLFITGIKPNVYHIIKETFRKQLILVNKTIPALQHFAIELSHLRGKAVQVKVEKDFSSGT